MHPDTDPLYIARRTTSEGRSETVVYNRRGQVVMSYPSDAPVEPAHVCEPDDGAAFFYGVINCIAITVSVLAISYLIASIIR